MRSISFILARYALCAWVGAAVLFVVTGVREVTTVDGPLADSRVRDALVAARFPAYYVFGFSAVAVGLTCTALIPARELGARRRAWIVGLMAAAFALMVIDYFWIYGPLFDMVTPPGKVRPANFVQFHKASMWINAADVGLCAIAAAVLCRPNSEGPGDAAA